MANWKFVVNGWGSILKGDGDGLERRDQIAALLRASEWYASQEQGDESELARKISEFEACDDEIEAEAVLWSIYDLADEERAFLDPDS
ncbi:hypothetical protein [Mycobacterium sp. M26]|uniref:hypothetical protein n=1 Tax=Mycobacterium sp. M26 TaxID=1762962 RepID=UPI00073EF05F|nr:hypothetical protein [Mycobacterium sp. M26]